MTADTLSLPNGVVSNGDPKQNSNASTKKSRESERRRRRRKQKKNSKASKAFDTTAGDDSDAGDDDAKENNDPQQVYLLIRFSMHFRVFCMCVLFQLDYISNFRNLFDSEDI